MAANNDNLLVFSSPQSAFRRGVKSLLSEGVFNEVFQTQHGKLEITPQQQ